MTAKLQRRKRRHEKPGNDVGTRAHPDRVRSGTWWRDRGPGEPRQQHFLQRLHPVGGWNPYGGGLLHWWNPHCFPCQCGGPDDYCRKPLPRVCWPPYPPYYICGAAGDRLSPEQWFPGLQQAALRPTRRFLYKQRTVSDTGCPRAASTGSSFDPRRAVLSSRRSSTNHPGE